MVILNEFQCLKLLILGGYMKMLVTVMAMALLVGCSKEDAKKKAAELVTSNVSSVLVNSLECTNADAVKADVGAQVDKLFKIEAEAKSMGEAFCNSVVDIVVPKLVSAGLPAAWGCKATSATAEVLELAKKGCSSL
jgi:hypothetical protein